MKKEQFTKEMQKRILDVCEQLLKEKWQSPVSPGCARAISEVYCRAGFFEKAEQNIQLTYHDDKEFTYTTHKHTDPGSNIPGAVVFLDYTYDWNQDGVIDGKDTYTHVGIIKDGKVFYHYSSKYGWTTSNLDEWYVHEFRIPKKDCTPATIKKEYDVLKIFINPNNDGTLKSNIIFNGEKMIGYTELMIKMEK
jgi:hypothetical protein